MKLVKYIINLIILVGSLFFLNTLDDLNKIGENSLMIKIPFLGSEGSEQSFQEFNVWIVILGVFTAGVLLGFFIALFQILSQKGELLSSRSKIKRLQVEINNLRNESIDEDIEISDSQDLEVR